MSKQLRFNKVKEDHLPKLEQFIPIVDRVHGDKHPEFHEVRRLYNVINEKIKAAGAEKPDLKEEFTSLRKITDNYTVPDDVCETYEAVYNILAEVNEAYQA